MHTTHMYYYLIGCGFLECLSICTQYLCTYSTAFRGQDKFDFESSIQEPLDYLLGEAVAPT